MADKSLSIEECAAAMVELYMTLQSGETTVVKSMALPIGTVNRWDVTVDSKKDPTYYMKYGKDDWREVKSNGRQWVLTDGGKKATDNTSGKEHEPRDPKGMLEHRIAHIDRILTVASDRFASAGSSGGGRVAHDVGYALAMAKTRLMAMGEEGKKAWEAEVGKSWERLNKILETNDLMKAGKSDSIDPAVKAMYKRVVGLLGESFIREAKGEDPVPQAPVAKPKDPEVAKPVAEKPVPPKAEPKAEPEVAAPKKKKAAGKKEPKKDPEPAAKVQPAEPVEKRPFPEGEVGSDELDDKVLARYFATKDKALIEEYLRRMYAMRADEDYGAVGAEFVKHQRMFEFAATFAPEVAEEVSSRNIKPVKVASYAELVASAKDEFENALTTESLAIQVVQDPSFKFKSTPPGAKEEARKRISQRNLNEINRCTVKIIGDKGLSRSKEQLSKLEHDILFYIEDYLPNKQVAGKAKTVAIEHFVAGAMELLRGISPDEADAPKPKTAPREDEPEGVDAETDEVATRDLFIDGDLLDDPEEKPKPSVFEPESEAGQEPTEQDPEEDAEAQTEAGDKQEGSKLSKREAKLAKQLKAAQVQIDGLMKKIKEASTTKDKEAVQQALGQSLDSLSGGLVFALGLPFAAAMLVLALPLLLLLAVNKVL